MKYALILAALMLAGCDVGLPPNLSGGPEPRPPVAARQTQAGDIVDIKIDVPACPNNLGGESTLEDYYRQRFRDDERDAAKRFFAKKHSGCFFTKQMTRGVVVIKDVAFYCIRGHGDADCIWVANNSFVFVEVKS